MAITEGILAKLVHAVAGGAGAAVAMIILTPRSMWEAFARGTVGVFCATVGVVPALRLTNIAADPDNTVLMAYAIGFVAWFLLGAAARTLEAWRQGGIKAIFEDFRKIK